MHIVVPCVRNPIGVCTFAETLPNVTKRVTYGVYRRSRGVAAHWDGLTTIWFRSAGCRRFKSGISQVKEVKKSSHHLLVGFTEKWDQMFPLRAVWWKRRGLNDPRVQSLAILGGGL